MHTSRLKKLLNNLNHHDAHKRRFAAEALADGDERAIYPLIKALRDDNLGVQDAAMHSLMEIKDETTAYMVLPLLREDSFLRNTAMIILREMGQIAVPLFRGLLKDKDDDVRKFVLDLVHDIEYCDYPDLIGEMLTDDPNANVRASAAKALGILRYRKAVPLLIQTLRDDEWVCFSAIEALTQIGDRESIDPIIKLLESPSETVRFAAIEALGKIPSRKTSKSLMEHIPRAEDYEKKITVKSLLRTGTVPSMPGITDLLTEMLKTDEWEDIAVALQGLSYLKDKKAIPVILDLAGSLDLSVPDSEDKLHMLKDSLRRIGCVEILIDILKDNSVRYKGKILAIEILGEMGCKEAVSTLIELLHFNYRDIRRSSIKSLSQMETDEAKDSLIEAVMDPDSHVRKTAVRALGKIKEMSAFETLLKMLHEEQYADIIDEFVVSLLKIDAKLFMSRKDEFNDIVKQSIKKHTAIIGPGVPC